MLLSRSIVLPTAVLWICLPLNATKRRLRQRAARSSSVKNTDKLALFTDKGQMHPIKVLDLPFGKFRDKDSRWIMK